MVSCRRNSDQTSGKFCLNTCPSVFTDVDWVRVCKRASRWSRQQVRSRIGSICTSGPGAGPRGQGPCRPMGRAARGGGQSERLKERHKYNQVLRSSGHDVPCENTSTSTHSDSGWPRRRASAGSGQPLAAGPLPVSEFQIMPRGEGDVPNTQPRAPKPRNNVKAAADVKFANVADFNRRCGSLGEKPGTYSTRTWCPHFS